MNLKKYLIFVFVKFWSRPLVLSNALNVIWLMKQLFVWQKVWLIYSSNTSQIYLRYKTEVNFLQFIPYFLWTEHIRTYVRTHTRTHAYIHSYMYHGRSYGQTHLYTVIARQTYVHTEKQTENDKQNRNKTLISLSLPPVDILKHVWFPAIIIFKSKIPFQ